RHAFVVGDHRAYPRRRKVRIVRAYPWGFVVVPAVERPVVVMICRFEPFAAIDALLVIDGGARGSRSQAVNNHDRGIEWAPKKSEDVEDAIIVPMRRTVAINSIFDPGFRQPGAW